MKLLTLNAHSHAESNYEEKLHLFTEGIAKLQPDIIALQEVSQTIDSSPIASAECTGYCSADEDITIGTDNHLYRAAKLLREQELFYYWTWLPIKQAYGNLYEGIGLMSRTRITDIRSARISRTDDRSDWRRRMLLGIRTEEYGSTWFYSTHMSRWDDLQEPFSAQWEAAKSHLPTKDIVWLMGDFNNPAEIRREGYDCITQSGWYDAHLMAKLRDQGMTVPKPIDGWRDRPDISSRMRIDQIWCSRHADVIRSETVFNGNNLPVVSDHFGVLITVAL